MMTQRRVDVPCTATLLGLAIWLGACASSQPETTTARPLASLSQAELAGLPIGVFDSGTGGLTVLEAILTLDRHANADGRPLPAGDGIPDFANERFIYYGDQANMPYGRYHAEGNTELLVEHIAKDARFLLGTTYYQSGTDPEPESDKQPVKAVVIACNTATAFGIDTVRGEVRATGRELPVIGVIGAGARAALDALGPELDGAVAVLATEGTVVSQGYPRALTAELERRGHAGAVEVRQQGCIGLAGAIDGMPEYFVAAASAPRPGYAGPAVDSPSCAIDPAILPRYGFDTAPGALLCDEAGTTIQLNSVGNYIAYHLTALVERMRAEGAARPLKAVILGCTHFPFYADAIGDRLRTLRDYQEDGRYVYRELLAENIVLVDPAQATAEELYAGLRERRLTGAADAMQGEFYIGVPNAGCPTVELDAQGGFTYAYKYGRPTGTTTRFVQRVPMSGATLDPAVVERLRTEVPLVHELLRDFNRSNPKTAYLGERERIR